MGTPFAGMGPAHDALESETQLSPERRARVTEAARLLDFDGLRRRTAAIAEAVRDGSLPVEPPQPVV
jgi:hypothetical protein